MMAHFGSDCEDKECQAVLGRFPVPQKEKIIPRSKKKKIILLSGPTAVGKSRLALKIAKAIGGEIISADSMQVYRGMDIGTAKVSLEERRQVPHHLIDSRDLDEGFNVVQFYEEASQAIKEIFSKGAVPILVGGTGFYIHALIYGPPTGPASVPEVRTRLEAEMDKRGAEALFEYLQKIDPIYASTITIRDRHKIVRALEIMEVSGQKVSDLPIPNAEHADLYDFRCWFMHMPKELLYQRIEERCDQMIQEGFIDEVVHLEQEGLGKNLTACQAIGYRQALEYLHSSRTPEDWQMFIKEFKQASRRYAKRQFTWFRKEPLFRWLDMSQVSMENGVEMIIQDYELSF
ncbi:MAG: tRNA (adenosine(37)-N6)-dimethylallyltransferase MiaA [Chlamydiales bacterium]|nr:tRNA (adenosine(37)-N6)-dimethylallyltransferase MiaA [Chlamydiales bacterium]